MQFIYKIEQQTIDESKDLIKTLETNNVKLHFQSDFMNFSIPRTIILVDQQDQTLFAKSVYVCSGTLIHLKHRLLKISFGGLIGQFELEKGDKTPDLMPEKWFMYIY